MAENYLAGLRGENPWNHHPAESATPQSAEVPLEELDPQARPTSAPPVLEFSKASLFAFSDVRAVQYARIFTDIRADEAYSRFYESYADPSKLPPPLDPLPLAVQVQQQHLMQQQQHQHQLQQHQHQQHSPQHSHLQQQQQVGLRHQVGLVQPPQQQQQQHQHQQARRLGPSSALGRKLVALEGAGDSSDSDADEAVGGGALLVPALSSDSDLHLHVQLHDEALAPPPGPARTPISQLASAFASGPASGLFFNPPAAAAASPPSRGSRTPWDDSPKAPAAKAPAPGDRCRYFLQGFCSRGDKCQFAHVPEDGQPTPAAPAASSGPSPPAPSRAAGRGARAAGKSNGTAANSSSGASSGPSTPANKGGDKSGKGARSPRPKLDAAGAAERSRGDVVSPRGVPATSPRSPRGPDVSNYTKIDDAVGHIYSLCKDQHGCRFLQKQLEDKVPRTVDLIYAEVYPHFVELMTDPFGNYLCQKLLEHAPEPQREALIARVAPSLAAVAQNMHGTRAVQKMIEFLSTDAMVGHVIAGLRANVVTLIQDLNGNHVIQRCLNRLAPQHNQFIYDAVAQNCMAVATHRHGCCVMQRCIDFASEAQQRQLIAQIIVHANALVRDAFGNYVVQYIMDLPYADLVKQLVARFAGHLAELSTQKFSSNVIEKCLKAADPSTLALMVQEIIDSDALLMLLQDPYGNYVVQTSLTLCDAGQYKQLVDIIRPHLPAIRNTPYGKRIQNKILKERGGLSAADLGQAPALPPQAPAPVSAVPVAAARARTSAGQPRP